MPMDLRNVVHAVERDFAGQSLDNLSIDNERDRGQASGRMAQSTAHAKS